MSIVLKGRDSLLLGCIYRSPSKNATLETAKLCHLLKQVVDTNPTHLVIAGDFNYSEINWIDWYSTGSDTHYTNDFIQAVQDCFLFQHVTRPTRYRLGNVPNPLDLILSNEEGMVSSLDYLPGLGLSDHACLSFDVNCYIDCRKNEEPRFSYDRGDYSRLNSLLEDVEWEEEMERMNYNQAWDYFEGTYSKLIEECIPKNKSGTKKKNKYLTREAMKCKRKKYQQWKKFTDSQDYLDYARFARARNSLRGLTRTLGKAFEHDLVKKLKKNPKAFWSYANSRLKTRTRIDELEREDGTRACTSEDVVEVLNQFFSSVFTQEDLSTIPTLDPKYHGPPLEDIEITPDMILKKLQRLKVSKSPGPDGFHPRVLKETAVQITLPLTILFRKSLDTGQLPGDWKLGHISPIHKKGNRRTPGNYRPVSLTSVIGKVLESLIRGVLVEHMLSNHLFTDEQHGFVPGRSCMTQLLLVMEEWVDILEEGYPMDVIYLDFRKAFDSVPHQRLLNKLQAYGIKGKLLAWIRNFLTGRRQRVVYDGEKSEWSDVMSGIPQGSVLGPVLFVIFINDLPSVVKSAMKVFADDTKVYNCVKEDKGVEELQADIESMARWGDKWQLPFNTGKCKSLHLGRTNSRHVYTLNGNDLEQVHQEKDLGVVIDDRLKFHTHTTGAVNKANQILAVIKKSFMHLDSVTVPLLYKSIVRPHLEYGNLIWGPHYKLDQLAVERVQRRATKLVPELKERPYEERLRRLHIPSLYYRRRRGDMIQMFKIMTGIERIDPVLLFKRPPSRSTRGHRYKVFKPHAQKMIRRHCLSVRALDDWHSLPDSIFDVKSVDEFKAKLDKHWMREQYALPA